MPKVSIITATFNNGSTITDTIKGLEMQSRPFEWIVQDAMSKDDTLKMVESSSLNAHVVSEKDGGLYDALNRAVKRCSGEIIGLCHADDVLASEAIIAKVESHFENHPEAQALYFDLEYWNADFSKRIRQWKSGVQENMVFGWMPPHPTLFVRKNIFDTVGYYKTNMGSAADYEWMLRAIQVHKIPFDYIPLLAVKMRVGGMSSSGFKSRIEAVKGDYLAWRMNGYSMPIFQVGIKKLRKISQFF